MIEPEHPPLPIYLDYNATSPVAPRVITAMMPFFARQYGNASSSHAFGLEAKQALDEARSRVASLLNCIDDEVVFTGGGSEANNLAVKGVAMRHPPGQTHIISSVIDHPSVLKSCYALAQRCGVTVTLVPVNEYGAIDPEAVIRAITPHTRLISVMLANNEVGTLQPIADIAAAVRANSSQILIHTDAAQAAGKIPVDVQALNVDLLTIAAHKFCGPKGVGALYVRQGVELDPLVEGAGHERGRRSGTENIPGIVGLGMAAQLARHGFPAEMNRLQALRDRLQKAILANHPDAIVNGHPDKRLPNTLNVCFPGLVGNDILVQTPGVAASTGAACHSGSVEPSSVLLSMGLTREAALGALRLSIGRYTTEDQITRAAGQIVKTVKELRARPKTEASRFRIPMPRREKLTVS